MLHDAIARYYDNDPIELGARFVIAQPRLRLLGVEWAKWDRVRARLAGLSAAKRGA